MESYFDKLSDQDLNLFSDQANFYFLFRSPTQKGKIKFYHLLLMDKIDNDKKRGNI